MASTKKQAKKQAESAAPYVRRLLEDRYVQEQLQSALAGARGAYERIRHRGTAAAEDKKLYGNLRQAASSMRNVANAMQRPKPQPKRRFQKLAAAGLAAGSALLVARQQKGRPGGGGSGGSG